MCGFCTAIASLSKLASTDKSTLQMGSTVWRQQLTCSCCSLVLSTVDCHHLQDGSSEVWAAPLVNNQRAVVLFNRHWTLSPRTIRVTWAQLGYTSEAGGPGFKGMVRDLYAERDLGVYEGGFEAKISAHDCVIIKVTPVTQVVGHTTGHAGHTLDSHVITPGVPASHTSWRPWSDPAAAELQARLRAKSQRRRQWDAFVGRLLGFLVAHKYALATLAVVLLLGGLTTCLAHWRLRVRARSRSSSSGGKGVPTYGAVKYVAVEHHEMSFSGAGKSLSVPEPDAIMMVTDH